MGPKKEQAQGEKARQEVKKKRKKQMLYEENVAEKTLCGLAGQQSALHMTAGAAFAVGKLMTHPSINKRASGRVAHVLRQLKDKTRQALERALWREGSLLPGKQSELYRKFLRKHIFSGSAEIIWT